MRTLMHFSAPRTRAATPGVSGVFYRQPHKQSAQVLPQWTPRWKGSSSARISESRAALSMVSETLTSEVETISTGVSIGRIFQKSAAKNPCAPSIRVERIFTTVIPRLQVTDLSMLLHGTASATILVPGGASGRREFKIHTGMFFSFAGSTVAG